MRISQAFFPLVAATMLITGCSSKGPATSAVAQGEAALERVRSDASLYAKAELKAADDTMAKMKANLAKDDYEAVLADIPNLNSEVKIVQESIVSGQTLAATAQTEWATLNQEVPTAVEEIQARVDKLAGGKLPKEITKQTFDTAKAEFETMKATWAEATAAATSGKTAEAAEKGRTVQAKAVELKTQLGMSADAAVASIAAPAPGTN